MMLGHSQCDRIRDPAEGDRRSGGGVDNVRIVHLVTLGWLPFTRS
jgi:hypothetical protein